MTSSCRRGKQGTLGYKGTSMYKVLLEMGQGNSEMQRTSYMHDAVSNGSSVNVISKERVWD